MKKILLIASAIVLTGILSAQSPAPYCPVSYSNVPCNTPGPSNSPGNGVNDFIHSFNTTGASSNITNNNSGCNGGVNNYIRYNCNQHFLKVMPGQVITCNVQSGITFSQGFAIFVDWNQNNVFDIPAERVTATPGVPAAGSWSAINFTVPAAQATGQYRMRVRCAYTTAGVNIGPCQGYGFGETEDYELFVNMDPLAIGGTALSSATGVCPGQNTTLSLTGQSGTIQWQSAPSANGPWTNITGATTTPYTTPPLNASTCYRAALTSCGQTVYSSVVCVPLGQLPTLNVNSPTICEGDTAVLTVNATPPGGTYLWNTGATTQSISVTPTVTTTYTVTYDLGGCIQTSTTTVIVDPNPPITFTGNTNICQGQSTSLTASSSNQYLWNTGETTQTINITPNATSSYTVTVFNVNGCSNSATVNVVVNPLPVPSFTSTAVCNGMMTTLTSTSTISSGTIVGNAWTEGANMLGNTSPLDYLFPSAGTIPVTLTVVSDQNCVGTITQNVVVNANPTVNFGSSLTVGCAPLCATLSDLSVVANSSIIEWAWTSNGVAISTVQNPNYCFDTPGIYDIGLTVTSAQGCIASLTLDDYITVNVMPTASFILPGDSFPLSNATLFMANQSINASSYEWNFGDSTTSTEVSPTHTFNETGLFCIQLTAYGAAGCVDVAAQCVDIYDEFFVYIPNSFTPDDDGNNDKFFVSGFGIKTVQMFIFNRWGDEIFQSDIGAQGNVYWNGLIKNTSEFAMQGSYVYKIVVTDFKTQQYDFYGDVFLIK